MKIILLILITIFAFTGCSNNESKDVTPPPSNEQIIESNENNSTDGKTTVEHLMDNALIDSMKNNEEGVIAIRDKMFIAQTNDIYLNPEEYTDKTIKWEGIYTEVANPETGQQYRFVIRYGPGCCGYDGTAGFEILYDGELPKKNDWVEAEGKIEMVEENGNEFIAIRLSNLTVLDVRGQEFVAN
ncbi:hypothetical protein [Sedimentibacter sp.]|uniref:TIGR03943 family putative permease subunit n=1 Tax=Sedimentibacter sp. TaxID=1960295 RepID=UPI00289CE678|nr:hypothetical protein [Sedimentibacter sp.]